MLRFCLPKHYSLASNEIHIWQTRLGLRQDGIERLRGILSVDERQRVGQFRTERDQTRHTLARGLLRLVVARLSNTPPEQLKIATSLHGKPYLLIDADQSRIEFNISHSGEMIYVAIANNRSVGIDVEKVQADFPFEMIAREAFSRTEFRQLMALDPALRLDSFFTCWTRKEAMLKARGKGLAALRHPRGESLFAHLPMPGRFASLEGDAVVNWTLMDLQTEAGYKAAVVFEGTDCHLRRWELADNWNIRRLV